MTTSNETLPPADEGRRSSEELGLVTDEQRLFERELQIDHDNSHWHGDRYTTLSTQRRWEGWSAARLLDAKSRQGGAAMAADERVKPADAGSDRAKG